jgi:hypothetical protein
VPSFVFSPGSPIAGQAVTFTSTTAQGDAAISGQAWDLDNDGQFDDASGPTATWTFPAAGTYTVRLRVSDANFPEATAPTTFQRIAVAAPPAPPAPPAPSSGGSGGDGSTTPAATTPAVTAASKKLGLLQPFPIVRIRGRTMGSGVLLSLLSVQAPSGASVRVVCKGRGCPKRRRLVQVVKARTGGVRFKQMNRRLARGATIEIFVTKPGVIGKYTRFRIRQGRAPARLDACVKPGSSKPITCPSG